MLKVLKYRLQYSDFKGEKWWYFDLSFAKNVIDWNSTIYQINRIGLFQVRELET